MFGPRIRGFLFAIPVSRVRKVDFLLSTLTWPGRLSSEKLSNGKTRVEVDGFEYLAFIHDPGWRPRMGRKHQARIYYRLSRLPKAILNALIYSKSEIIFSFD